MKGSIFDAADRRSLRRRVSSLRPESERKWGTMGVHQAVAHMADQIRMGLGLIEMTAPKGLFRFAPARYLIIHVLPWPEGKAQGPPEAFTTRPAEFQVDLEQLHELIDAIGGRNPAEDWPVHSIFGPMTGHDWGVLTYRHLDHHLRQFGC
ncbi:MAG: hypothetical protein R3282_00775 [Rhodothermales bacterium]|nr:hypothetical protein [Rhodothermales bacterium]